MHWTSRVTHATIDPANSRGQHEIPNWYVGGCGLSRCGLLGRLCLLQDISDNFGRTYCVCSRPFISTGRICWVLLTCRPSFLLGSTCECCDVRTDRPDRGICAEAIKLREIIQNSPPPDFGLTSHNAQTILIIPIMVPNLQLGVANCCCTVPVPACGGIA